MHVTNVFAFNFTNFLLGDTWYLCSLLPNVFCRKDAGSKTATANSKLNVTTAGYVD